MERKIIYSFLLVAMIGISMWAIVFGVLGMNGPVIKGEDAMMTSNGAPANGNWGLSYQGDNQAPIGNETQGYLKEFNAYYIDDDGTEDKFIYLTFDAGYENGYTDKILDILKKEKVPATFFLVGDYIKANPDIVRRMDKEGHIIGNHTMSHPDMSIITDQNDFESELKELEIIYEETTGHKMKKFYRPPQGKYSEKNLEMAKSMGYTTVFWSLAYVDWYVDKQPSREEALNILNKRIHDGAIVLLHSTSKTNSEILEELIKEWKKEGYKFKPLYSIML